MPNNISPAKKRDNAVKEQLKQILIRVVAIFVNGARFIIDKYYVTCRPKELTLAEGDRQIVLVNHYYWDNDNKEFCLSTFKLDPIKGNKQYKRCVRY